VGRAKNKPAKPKAVMVVTRGRRWETKYSCPVCLRRDEQRRSTVSICMKPSYPSRRLRRDVCWVLHDCCGHVGACVAAATTHCILLSSQCQCCDDCDTVCDDRVLKQASGQVLKPRVFVVLLAIPTNVTPLFKFVLAIK